MSKNIISRIHGLARKGREINKLEFLNSDPQEFNNNENHMLQIAGVGDDDSNDTSDSNHIPSE